MRLFHLKSTAPFADAAFAQYDDLFTAPERIHHHTPFFKSSPHVQTIHAQGISVESQGTTSPALFSPLSAALSSPGRITCVMGWIERLCAGLFSEANLTERDKLRPLANYGRINGRRRAPDGSRSCLPAPGRKRARGVRSDRRRQGRLVPVLSKLATVRNFPKVGSVLCRSGRLS